MRPWDPIKALSAFAVFSTITHTEDQQLLHAEEEPLPVKAPPLLKVNVLPGQDASVLSVLSPPITHASSELRVAEVYSSSASS